ncbi:MAG: hypothetical protein MPW16_01195 [Candidatus Manganitrophus sp.]|nr:MAG: hypothetical protein MPW16_01195 [Candidatus Manganitrophus sp.]
MKHRTLFLIVSAFILILFQREVSAQSIPLMIPHSGTVSVNGAPFNGNGLFKFAIVNDTGTVSWWTNDNTHLDGTEPDAAVTIPVTNGAFSVKLGDTNLGMVTIQTALFTNNSVAFLRIWFSDGVTGFQQLSPDRQLVSVPYAYHAETANSVVGANAPKSIIIPATAFAPSDETLAYTKFVPTNGFTQTTAGAGTFIAAIPIPTGSRITGLELRAFDSVNPGNVRASIIQGSSGVIANSTAQTTDAEVGCFQCTRVSGVINETISSDVSIYYWIQVDISVASGSLGFYAVKVIYTSP